MPRTDLVRGIKRDVRARRSHNDPVGYVCKIAVPESIEGVFAVLFEIRAEISMTDKILRSAYYNLDGRLKARWEECPNLTLTGNKTGNI
jgi:hypothetical protein